MYQFMIMKAVFLVIRSAVLIVTAVLSAVKMKLMQLLHGTQELKVMIKHEESFCVYANA